MVFKIISREEARKYIDLVEILLMTGSKQETEILHKSLEIDNREILKVGIDAHTYYIAVFGKYWIAQVQFNAGQHKSSSSAILAGHAINIFKLKAVVMLGLGIGILPKTQKIGDVMVVEGLIFYHEKSAFSSDMNLDAVKSDLLLYNRFTNHKWSNDGQLSVIENLKPSVLEGRLFSVSKIGFNISLDRNLIESSETIGFESDGMGMAKVCDQNKVNWIVIKGVANTSAKGKLESKKKNIQLAIENATYYCKSVFSERYVFTELSIAEFEHNEPSFIQVPYNKSAGQKVLNYALYTPVTKEIGYYINRKQDDEIFNLFGRGLELISIWGPNRIGKTSMISNALNRAESIGIKTVYFSFQSIVSDVFVEILNMVVERINYSLNLSPVASKGKNPYNVFEQTIAQIQEPVVIAFDEVDILFGIGERDKFFSILRNVFFSGLSTYASITFIVSSIVNRADYIESPTVSPFNLGKSLHVENFTLDEVAMYFTGNFPQVNDNLVREIWTFTGGIPIMINYAAYFISGKIDTGALFEEIEKTALELRYLKSEFTIYKDKLALIVSKMREKERILHSEVHELVDKGILSYKDGVSHFKSDLVELLYNRYL